MARRKAKNPAHNYNCPVRTRVTQKTYDRLVSLATSSDSHTVGEVARKILSNNKIVVFTKDASMDGPLEELVTIRRELNAIGVNINQITHRFHASQDQSQRNIQAYRAAAEYGRVENKVNQLLEIVASLAKKWLQK